MPIYRRELLTKSILLMFISLLLISCGSGPKLARLQTDFELLYLQHLDMKAKNKKFSGKWYSEEDLETALRGVSLEAREAAEGQEVKPATRIAFLRLAMIAAWQGKEQNQDYIKGIVSKGKNLCNQLKPSEPTRDCALFIIIPVSIKSSNIPDPFPGQQMESLVAGAMKVPKKEADKANHYFMSMKKILTDVLVGFGKTELPDYLSRHSNLLGYYKDEIKNYQARIGDAMIIATSQIEDMPGGNLSQDDIKFSECAQRWIRELRKDVSLKLPKKFKQQALACLSL